MFRKFFYASAGLLFLALAYHLGVLNASAQGVGNPVVAACQVQNGGGWLEPVAITANGDVYKASQNATTWQLVSNVYTGPAPTSARTESFGSLKSRYR